MLELGMIRLGRFYLFHALPKPGHHFVELCAHFLHSFAPMADSTFFRHADLGKGLTELFIIKNRVLAKPCLSLALLGNFSLTAAFPGQGRPPGGS